MTALLRGLQEAAGFFAASETDLFRIVAMSLRVSLSATAAAMCLGVPLAVLLAMSRFRGRSLVVASLNAGMGLPPVVAGLVVVLALSRSGPLGFLDLLYTPAAMIVAQVVVAFPVVSSLSLAALQQVDRRIVLRAISLGATGIQLAPVFLREARLGVLAAVMAAFGAALSEVGAVMMTGGNIPGRTQVLTGAILQQTRMGRYEAAAALSLVLLLVSFGVSVALVRLQQKGRGPWNPPRNWR